MDGLIPIRNIWILFLYAADLMQVSGRFESEIEAARDLPDLVARLLIHSVEERLKRNLSRGYHSKAATLSRVRGRIDILETTTNGLMDRGVVACRYEEHTLDTPRNRLARAALDRLAGRVEDNLIGHRCRQLAGDLSRIGVSRLRPSWGELASDQIARNETGDRFMVALARLVFEALIPSEEAGRTTNYAPATDPHLVRHLFERAIGNALRIELGPFGWTVKPGRRLAWPISQQTPGLSTILPGMQTDIELNHASSVRRIVIDTKFTSILKSSSYRTQILKSGHLYQLYTYLRTQERAEDTASLSAEGLLLHPQIGGAVDEWMDLQGHRMRFRTIDLAASPGDFEARLRDLIPVAE
jgi:5-methylcytosine-specific restriction enzyme subunit McrC